MTLTTIELIAELQARENCDTIADALGQMLNQAYERAEDRIHRGIDNRHWNTVYSTSRKIHKDWKCQTITPRHAGVKTWQVLPR